MSHATENQLHKTVAKWKISSSACRCDFKVGGCLGGFRNFISMFFAKSLFCFMFFHPFQTSSASLFYFYLNFMKVFKRLLGLGSLECPEAFLVCWQVLLLISNDEIGLISS